MIPVVCTGFTFGASFLALDEILRGVMISTLLTHVKDINVLYTSTIPCPCGSYLGVAVELTNYLKGNTCRKPYADVGGLRPLLYCSPRCHFVWRRFNMSATHKHRQDFPELVLKRSIT